MFVDSTMQRNRFFRMGHVEEVFPEEDHNQPYRMNLLPRSSI